MLKIPTIHINTMNEEYLHHREVLRPSHVAYIKIICNQTSGVVALKSNDKR